ncbi:MAG: FtsX-like permease family protein [Candidatus Helarchaeota archaeon]
MNIFQYIKRDFKHLKSEFYTILITLMIINAVMTFLLFIGENFQFDLWNATSSNWLIQFMGNYLSLIIFMSFIFGFFIFFNIVSEMISSRKKEIGIIKTIGGIPKLIKSAILYEIILITVIGVFLGVFIGYISYQIFYFYIRTRYLITNITPTLALVVIILSFILSSWIINGIQVNSIYGKSINKLITDETEIEEKLIVPKKAKKTKFRFGMPYYFAKKNIKRYKSKSERLFLNILLCTILLSVSLTGSFLFQQTIINNQKIANGENMVVIGHKDMVFQYTSRMILYNIHLKSNLNYTSEIYKINSSVLSEFESIPYVLTDPRFIIEYTVQEIPYMQGYNPIGQSRIMNSFIIGAHPERFIPNMYLSNQIPFRIALLFSGPLFVISSDWLAHNLVDDAQLQNIYIYVPSGTNNFPIYKIMGICSDPINGGNLIYLNINYLRNISKYNSQNLLIMKYFHLGSLIEIANKIRELNGLGYDFIMLGTDWYLNNNISYTYILWLPFLIFPLSLFFIIIFILSSYLTSSIKRQIHDYKILKVLGFKSSTLKKTIYLQAISEIWLPSAIGIVVGTSIVFYLLYTQIVSYLLLFSMAIGNFLFMFFIAFLSILPAFKIIKQNALNTLVNY